MNKIRTALGLLFSMVNSGECHSTTSIKVFSEAIEENEQLQTKNLELENNQACSDCLPESYGWNYNAVEGRFPCACISESEAYQQLLADNQRLREFAEKEPCRCRFTGEGELYYPQCNRCQALKEGRE